MTRHCSALAPSHRVSSFADVNANCHCDWPKSCLRLLRRLLLLTLTLGAIGCNRVEIQPANSGSDQSTPAEAEATEPVDDTLLADPQDEPQEDPGDVEQEESSLANTWIPKSLPWEAWYEQYLGNSRIGFFHIDVRRGESLIRIKREAVYEITRGSNTIPMVVNLDSLEFPNGSMASFRLESQSGANATALEGKRTGNKLTLTRSTAEGPVTTAETWPDGSWGVLGVQSLLLAQPMKPGEEREASVFVPTVGKVVPVELKAGRQEITSSPAGLTPKLLPVEVRMSLGETSSKVKYWLDERGQIVKSVTLDGSLTSTFLTTPAVGQRLSDEFAVRSLMGQFIAFEGAVPDRPSLATAKYSVEGEDIDVFAIWSKNVRQSVSSVSALQSTVTVFAASEIPSDISPDEPTDEDTAASYWIDFENTAFDDFSDSGDGDSARDKCLKLALTVADRFQRAPLAGKFAQASEVAKSWKGDSIHATTVLTALLRKQAIPARVAIGYVIDGAEPKMRLHFWSEAWLGDGWLSLDALEGGLASTDRLKLLNTSLANDNPYADVLPVLQQMTNLRVSLVP